MKVIVDDILRVREFGRRGGFKPDEIRFYYQVVGYNCVMLRCDQLDYHEWNGKAAVVLFDFDTMDGRKIAEAFPGAPASWAAGDVDLIGVTVRPDRNVLVRPRGTLSQAIRNMIGQEC